MRMRERAAKWRRGTVAGLGMLMLVTLPAFASGTAGGLDTSFGADGVFDTTSSNGAETSIVRQSSGKLVFGGTENGTGADGAPSTFWRLVRLDDGGALDTSFGTSGEVALFGDYRSDRLNQIVLDSSGRLLCAGRVSFQILSGRGKKQKVSQFRRFTVVRLLADGALDTAFGDGGVVTIAIPSASNEDGEAKSIHMLSSGKILVVGRATGVAGVSSDGGGKKKKGGGQTSTSDAIVLVRLLDTGALDMTFGDSGIAVHDATTGDDQPRTGALVVQGSGRIVVGGVGGADEQWVLTAYAADGSVDATFGRVSVADAFLRSLAIDASDRIVGCGEVEPALGVNEFVLTRHASDGSLDTGFGSGGSVSLGLSEDSLGGQVVIQSDGKIVAALNVWDANWILSCQPVRFTTAGALDTSFGIGGFGGVLSEVGVNYGLVQGALIDPDGDIVLTGQRFASGFLEWLVVRWCGG